MEQKLPAPHVPAAAPEKLAFKPATSLGQQHLVSQHDANQPQEHVSTSSPSNNGLKELGEQAEEVRERDVSSSLGVSKHMKSSSRSEEISDTKETERSLLSSQVERPLDIHSPHMEWSSASEERTLASSAAPVLRNAPLDISETHEQALPTLEKVQKVQQLINHMDEHVLRLVVSKQHAMVITLVPDSLGTVVLSVNEDERHHVVVEMLAESHTVLNVLKQQEAHLRDLFEQNGYKLSSFNVRQQLEDHDRERRSDELARKGAKGKNLPANSSVNLTPNTKETVQKWSHSTGVWFVA